MSVSQKNNNCFPKVTGGKPRRSSSGGKGTSKQTLLVQMP